MRIHQNVQVEQKALAHQLNARLGHGLPTFGELASVGLVQLAIELQEPIELPGILQLHERFGGVLHTVEEPASRQGQKKSLAQIGFERTLALTGKLKKEFYQLARLIVVKKLSQSRLRVESGHQPVKFPAKFPHKRMVGF